MQPKEEEQDDQEHDDHEFAWESWAVLGVNWSSVCRTADRLLVLARSAVFWRSE